MCIRDRSSRGSRALQIKEAPETVVGLPSGVAKLPAHRPELLSFVEELPSAPGRSRVCTGAPSTAKLPACCGAPKPT
eukprot:5612419-Alexandrium_andersonii.AAC.1